MTESRCKFVWAALCKRIAVTQHGQHAQDRRQSVDFQVASEGFCPKPCFQISADALQAHFKERFSRFSPSVLHKLTSKDLPRTGTRFLLPRRWSAPAHGMHGAVCQRSFRSTLGVSLLASRTAAKVAKCRRRSAVRPITAYKVDINFNGRTETLEVAEDQTILEVALEQGIELSHDCKMGVCMTCPAKLVRPGCNHSHYACLLFYPCAYISA